jgi:uncharacterized protein DUF4304
MARRMAAAVDELRPLFAARGFRKRRNSFNRTAEPGLVHVVAFVMGRYELYGEQHDPFAGDYGFYRIDFGVYVEEVARRLQGRYGADFVTEADCELRLSSAPQSWYLGEEPERLAGESAAFLEAVVFPLFGRLATRDAILGEWERDPGAVPLTRRRLAVAMIELERGNVGRAARLVAAHLDGGEFHPAHRDWVLEHVSPQLGSAE